MKMVSYEPMESSVRLLYDKIEQNKTADQKLVIEAATELAELAEQQKRADLLGYALFSKAYAFYNLDEITKAFMTFEKAIIPLSESGQWNFVARSYCAMGIVCNNQGNAPMALDYYLKGLSVCEKHNVISYRATIDCNIGILYLWYHDLENAKYYFEKSLECVEKVKEEQGDYEPTYPYSTVAAMYFNKSNIELLLGNIDSAVENIQKAYDLEQKSPDEPLNLSIEMLKAKILYAMGKQNELDQCIQDIDRRESAYGSIVIAFDDLMNYASFLQLIGHDKEFYHTVEVMENAIKETDSVFMNRRLAQLKADFYKSRNQQEEFLREASRYYELSREMEAELETSYRESLSIRVSLENEKRTKETLKNEAESFKSKSEVDALTGLRNRYKISEISESSFASCLHNHQPLAVEILDVDYFKQYNDNYGHQKGDDVLIKVSAAIHSLEKYPGVYTGRYGGDEFIILYVNHTCAEVLQCARELKDVVERMNITHEFSPIRDRVTMSQGVFYGTPDENHTFWDFLHTADQMLYDVKRAGRDDFRISTEQVK